MFNADGPPDLGKCLAVSSKRHWLPIVATFDARGRVVDLEFYSQCSGERFDVDAATSACIRGKLERWRWWYMVDGVTFHGSAKRGGASEGCG
jgi:hypothetical protein